jgi:predicted transcriptional regulator
MVGEKERRVTPVGIRLPPSLKATLEEIARKERRSLASLVQIILEDWVAKHKAESGKLAGKRK